MIERRRFLTMSAGGLAIGAAAVAVPTSVAQAATRTTRAAAVTSASWRRLTGATVHAIDPTGEGFRLTVGKVVANATAGSASGEAFSVALHARTHIVTDGIYRITHRYLGGSSDLFLVGGGATTATMSVDTRVAAAAR